MHARRAAATTSTISSVHAHILWPKLRDTVAIRPTRDVAAAYIIVRAVDSTFDALHAETSVDTTTIRHCITDIRNRICTDNAGAVLARLSRRTRTGQRRAVAGAVPTTVSRAANRRGVRATPTIVTEAPAMCGLTGTLLGLPEYQLRRRRHRTERRSYSSRRRGQERIQRGQYRPECLPCVEEPCGVRSKWRGLWSNRQILMGPCRVLSEGHDAFTISCYETQRKPDIGPVFPL